jgi:hypothetical protein
MHIASTSAVPAAPVPAPSSDVPSPTGDTAWTNPAAAAALRSTADLLQNIEDGVVRNFRDVELVRAYASDLRSTSEIFETATAAISGDASKENDSFLPLISNAGGGVERAEARLTSKELSSTWPLERSDILAAIRRAKAISQNVADQLDPRSVREPR